jgi:multiple sugar transport system substrate-binding protein
VKKTTKKPVESAAPRKGLTRREFTKSTAAVAAGTSLGIFGGVAPAFAQKREVHHVAWNNFIPPADDLTREHAANFEKETGVAIRFETINQNDLQAKAAAAIEGGAGPDILQLHWNHAHLYAGGLIDHSGIFDLDGGDTVYGYQKEAVIVDGVPRGIPYYGIGNIMAYRTDVYADLGIEVPDTWDEYLAAGKKCKAEGWPFGQTLGHTLGDAPMFTYPLLWSFGFHLFADVELRWLGGRRVRQGGRQLRRHPPGHRLDEGGLGGRLRAGRPLLGGSEIDESGKVAINSAATHRAVDFMKEAWDSIYEPGGLSWDDGSNNRAFLSEQICTTANGASIYFVARLKDMNHIADNMSHYLFPKGDAGRFCMSVPLSFCIPTYSENQEAAMEWIRFQLRPDNYERYIAVQNCFGLPRAPGLEDHPVWNSDPAVSIYAQVPQYGRNFGWPGPFGRAASEVQSKYIIVDMFAKAVQGASAQEAAAWAEKELKNVYGA